MSPGGLLSWWYPVVAWGMAFAALGATVVGACRPTGTGLLPWPARGVPLLCGLVAFVPLAGLPVGRWLLGVSGPFSVPLVAVFLDQAAAVVLGRPLLDTRARWTAIGFALACGLALYPAGLGLGRFDPYTLGWATPGVAAAAAVLAAGLLLSGNGFGWVLLATGALWQWGTLESTNGWNYLVDPISVTLAAAAAAGTGLTGMLRHASRRRWADGEQQGDQACDTG